MRLFKALTLALSGCSAMAALDSLPKPTGEEVFDILFANSDLSLDGEPLCEMQSATKEKTPISLGQHLATVLSVSYENPNTVQINTSCTATQYEDESHGVMDAWDCQVEVLEEDTKGQFISSSMIAFSTGLAKKQLLPGSLRCF